MILKDISLSKALLVNHSRKEYVNGISHTNTIESFWAIFKRGIKGQFHFVSPKYPSGIWTNFAGVLIARAANLCLKN